MARVHDLIEKVSDPALREALAVEIRKLEKNKKFGLVFEEHLPEAAPLPGVPVRAGMTVATIEQDGGALYRVAAVDGDKVKCVDEISGADVEFARDEVVAVAKFGEPIYPYLEKVDEIEHGGGDLWHALIQADNYHALQLLEYLYPGQVDCIYIDPPYNTGAKDWKYNNDYVDGNDGWRHSKWLSMMEHRLRIAKRLLNPKDSVLIVTIDEKEYLHLGMLLEQMFPEASLTMCSDVINPRAGVARPGAFTRTHEYVYYLQFGEAAILPVMQDDSGKKNPIWFSLMRTGSNSARIDRPNLFYPIWCYCDGRLHSIGSNISLDASYKEIKSPEEGLIAVWPLRPDGRENTWQLGRDSLRTAFEDGTARTALHGGRITISYLRTAEKKRIGV